MKELLNLIKKFFRLFYYKKIIVRSINITNNGNIEEENQVRLPLVYSDLYVWHKTSFYIRFINGTFCIYSNYFKLNICKDDSLDVGLIKYIENDTAKFVAANVGTPVEFIELIGVVKMSTAPELLKHNSLDNIINSEFNIHMLN